MSHIQRIPLEGTQNLRDLGGYMTAEGPIQMGRFLRADGLHRLSQDAQSALQHLQLIIDLRHHEETLHEPNLLASCGISYQNISLFAGLDPSRFSTEEGCAPEDTLLSLYRQTLQNNGAVFAEILTALAEAPEGPVLFHCTAGKDRTGLVAMMLLSLAGAAREDIIQDYALTEHLIADLIATITSRIDAAGGDGAAYARAFLHSRPQTMALTLDYIEAEFGTVANYLAKSGLRAETITRLKDRLLR